MAKHEHAPLGQLLLSVAEAVAEVILIALVGWILARRGILDDKLRKSLNRINVSVFTPALLFSKVAFSLTPAKLSELWIVPVCFVVITIVSAGVGWALGRIFRLKRRSQRAFAIACAAFPNTNSLPVALMQSLVLSVKDLKWGEHDTKDQMLGRALSYLVLFSTLGIVMRWSVGVKLLTIPDDPPEKVDSQQTLFDGDRPTVQSPSNLEASGGLEAENPFDDDIRARLLDAGPEREAGALNSRSTSGVSLSEQIAKNGKSSKGRKQSRHATFPSFPNTPAHSVHDSLSSSEDDEGGDEEWGDVPRGVGRAQGTTPSGGGTRGSAVRKWRKTKSFSARWIGRPLYKTFMVIRGFMTVPLYAALASIIVALIPPLQYSLERIKPVVGSINSAGACSVPITLVVLGGMFSEDTAPAPSKALKPGQRPSTFRRISSQRQVPARSGELRTILVAILARQIVTPLLILPLFYLYAKKTVNVADDSVFCVVFALVAGSPPAITLAQITDAAAPAFERLISRTLLYAYTVLTPPTTLILVVVGLLIGEGQK